MKNSPNDLSSAEVHSRLKSYPRTATEITVELSRFGEALIRENEERAGSLDGKATNIMGYAGVILAFLFSHDSKWPQSMTPAGRVLILIAIVSAGVATVAAFWGTWSKKWGWFSDKDWFREGTFDDPEKLRRYYISRFHAVKTINSEINRSKGAAVLIAQMSLATATVALACALVMSLGPTWFSGFFGTTP